MILKEIKHRHSPLLFKKKSVSKKILEECVEAARWTPSCYNNQPWKFVLITGKKEISALEKVFSVGNHWALKAPVVGFLVSREEDDCIVESNGLSYFQYDCGMAMMAFVIQAEKEGLKSHQMAGYDEEKVKKQLKIPKGYRVLSAFAMGYEEELKNYKEELHPKLRERILSTKRVRKPLNEIYSVNQW